MKMKGKEFSHVGKNIIKYTVIMNERNSLMDRFQMNRSGVRPYNYTCGMNNTSFPLKIRNPFYKLIALGLGTEYAFQVFLTIGGVTKFIPSTASEICRRAPH